MQDSPRQELLNIQKKLWKWNKDIIDHSVLVQEPGFDAYEKEYKRAVGDYLRVSDQDEMMDAVLRSDIIHVGDYHTCNQSQRSFLRILKAAVKEDPSFVVGLELLHKRHQKVLDDYLTDRISEATFLKKIRLKEHWVFDLWENFKPIFDFCRYHGLEMFAIDAAPKGSDVVKRDRASARLISEVIRQNPGRRFFVFIGDLHVSPSHLPLEVEQELLRKNAYPKQLILYQNSERIYWDLADAGVEEHVEVVLMPDGSFCRMHTPPVILQRSYLNWLEHEEGEIDYSDAKASFIELVERICEFLRLSVGSAAEDVEVFTCGDLSFLKHLKDREVFSAEEIDVIKRQILASESYFISKAKIVYLANLSINHASEEAAHFIKNVCSGSEEPRELIDAFYANLLHEALGFFGSKLINNRRKCYHEKDFKNLLVYFQTARVSAERRLEYETAHLVMEYLKRERSGRGLGKTEIFKSRMDLFLSITHALGYMLGDSMYYGMMAGKIKRSEIKSLFEDPWAEKGRPLEVYAELRHTLRGVRIPKRM